MMPAQEQLWRKETSAFLVEILVGQAWVKFDGRGHSTLLEASAAAVEAGKLQAVRAVRIGELDTVQTYSILSEERQERPAEVVRGMRATGKTAPCPKCKEPAPVSLDGSGTSWTICAPCGALPTG